MASHSCVEFEFRIVHQDGTVRWLAQVCQPVLGEQGEYLGLRGSNREVTERKRAEQALRDADRRKDEFLAMLAHELRNPLAAIPAPCRSSAFPPTGRPTSRPSPDAAANGSNGAAGR